MADLGRRRTPVSREEAATALVGAWTQVVGAPPSRNAAELLLAQWWLETAQGQSMFWFNVGNITGSYQGNFWRPPWFEPPTAETSERNRRLHELMQKNQAPRSFRAYPNLAAGARDYVSMMNRKFKSVLRAAEAGDVASFAIAVRDSGYCPDCNPAHTEPTFRAFRDQFRADGVFAHLRDQPTEGGGAGPLVAVALIVTAIAMGRKWLT